LSLASTALCSSTETARHERQDVGGVSGGAVPKAIYSSADKQTYSQLC
jgi:hypothetical protein